VARINLVEVHHLTGNLRKSLELADRTVAHAREVDHRYGIALGLRYRVLALTDIGRLPEAIDNAQDSLEVQRAMGNAEDLLATLVVLARALLAAGEARASADTVDEALELAEGNDAEGFEPVLWAWRARLWMQAGDRAQAEAALAQARRLPGRQWPHQQARYKLNLARAHEALGLGDAAADLAEEALRIADSCGYRFYAMRARQVAARCHPDEAARGRHARVGAALARSLAAGLDRDDADQFLLLQGIEPRPRRAGAGPHSLPPEPPAPGPAGGRI
jgi:tetratricopeptide (TPR) repeat protein